MTLATLEITDFRCIQSSRIEFDPHCNLLFGPNATGKTSILEAAFVLSCGRSFRSSDIEDLIRTGQSRLAIHGAIRGAHAQSVGVQIGKGSRTISVQGDRVRSFAPVAEILPVVAIDPTTHRLLEDGPSRRRRFMDWGTFHVEPRFIEQWRRYQCALDHRNAALKTNQAATLIRSWDFELAEAGTQISKFRSDYLEGLRPLIDACAKELLGFPVTVDYQCGWKSYSLLDALVEAWSRDSRLKATTAGPHRADFEILIDGVPSRHRISRGQQKLLACALILAQLQFQTNTRHESPCLLLDDPAAELDVENLERLLALIKRTGAQLIVTALDPDRVRPLSVDKMFHVERGAITPVL